MRDVALFRAAENGHVVAGEKHSDLSGCEVGPVVGVVVRPEFLAGDLSASQSLDCHAVLWREPAFAGGPVRDVAHIRVSKRPSHCNVSAEELDDTGGGFHSLGDVGFLFHAHESNLISSLNQMWLDRTDRR